MRQNDLTSPLPAEAFEGLSELDELDFYDNRLGPRLEDEEIKGCPNLTYVSSLAFERRLWNGAARKED